MKDNWNELFDSMKEDDILRNLPEDLPEMEDELAAKRIENLVMQEMKIDIGMQKKQKRKRFMVAAACCILTLGVFGHKPILAAFQRLFHNLPGVGVYINEEDKEIYEVKIDDPVMEKDGVRVELKNFYCADNQIFGQIVITGEDLMAWGKEVEIDPTDFSPEMDALEEKFFPTWYYSDIERKMSTGTTGTKGEDDGRIVEFRMECDEFLRLKQGFDTYQIHIAGFDERFTLKIVDPKTVEEPESLGYSVTWNNTTVVARAYLEENYIDVEYFVIPSEEVKAAREKYPFDLTMLAYDFDYENYFYIQNASGVRLKGKYESMGNGGKYRFQGTEADFPLTLHYSPFTGTNDEEHTLNLQLSEKEKMMETEFPKAEFLYGTVEILSAAQEDVVWEDSNTLSDRVEEATKITVTYQTVPKDGDRKMYAVEASLGEEEEYFDFEMDSEERNGIFVQKNTFYVPREERESLEILLHDPSYWIEGEYNITIEKPMPKE